MRKGCPNVYNEFCGDGETYRGRSPRQKRIGSTPASIHRFVNSAGKCSRRLQRSSSIAPTPSRSRKRIVNRRGPRFRLALSKPRETLSQSQLKNRLRCSGVGITQCTEPLMSRRRLLAITLYAKFSTTDGQSEATSASLDHHPPRYSAVLITDSDCVNTRSPSIHNMDSTASIP
jgi:hypothetical protein